MEDDVKTSLDFFKKHYGDRLDGKGTNNTNLSVEVNGEMIRLHHPDLKMDNGPRIFHHGKKTKDVIVLTHGYTDSPFYLQAVALKFHAAGLNVILPLLPAHGLREPGSALEDKSLDSQWRATIDHAVETATLLGDRISLGGLSTGGALSLNKILRDDEHKITGGLFLFSAAIDIGDLNERASKLNFLQSFIKVIEGPIQGEGRDPYKYPEMSQSGGMEVGQIVNDNNRRLQWGGLPNRIKNPVFAAHSTHDKTASLAGLIHFMTNHVENGVTMAMTQNRLRQKIEVGKTLLVNDHLEHACLTLAEDILLNEDHSNKLDYLPKANPQFAWMMKGAIEFFEQAVKEN